jgi:hypothetical protein
MEFPDDDWAAVDACTLPTAERPLRVAEFDTLFATALRGMERREPGWLRFDLDRSAEVQARELAARESSCCSFFDFRFEATGGGLALDVRVPEARIDVLDGIERRARAVGPVPGSGTA